VEQGVQLIKINQGGNAFTLLPERNKITYGYTDEYGKKYDKKQLIPVFHCQDLLNS
jgi:hypothetical protein